MAKTKNCVTERDEQPQKNKLSIFPALHVQPFFCENSRAPLKKAYLEKFASQLYNLYIQVTDA